MKKAVIFSMIILVLFGMIACTSGNSSAPAGTASSIEDSQVQVWMPGLNTEPESGLPYTFEASGIAVGDGSEVLTVLNYETYSPGPLKVVWPGHGTYDATVQAIDPRTSATLLKLKDAKIPIFRLETDQTPVNGQEVSIKGWSYEGNNLQFESIPGTISKYLGPYTFLMSDTQTPALREGINVSEGSIITGEGNKVLGLQSKFHIWPVFHSIREGWSPAISIDSAMEVSATGASVQPYASGPAMILYLSDGEGAEIMPPPAEYESFNIALQALYSQLGKPLDVSDFTFNQESSSSGRILVLVYPQSVELLSPGDKAIAQAKWVGIQWDRGNGKPSRLVYGSRDYEIAAGYRINADLNAFYKEVMKAMYG